MLVLSLLVFEAAILSSACLLIAFLLGAWLVAGRFASSDTLAYESGRLTQHVAHRGAVSLDLRHDIASMKLVSELRVGKFIVLVGRTGSIRFMIDGRSQPVVRALAGEVAFNSRLRSFTDADPSLRKVLQKATENK